MNLLLMLLLLQDRPVDASIEAFLNGDEAARAELVKHGAFAIRPLLKARDRAAEKIEALLLDLKQATAYPAPVALPGGFKGGMVISLSLEGQTHLGGMVRAFQGAGVPVFSDRFESTRLAGNVGMFRATNPRELVDGICRVTGLDFGFFHNFVVIGLPERLWASRVRTKPPALDAPGRGRALEWIRKLGDESIEVRETASAELAKFGRQILPLLEEHRSVADREIAARCDSIIRRLRAPSEGAFGPSACVGQRLDGEDLKVLQALQTMKPRVEFYEAKLVDVADRLRKDSGVDFEIPEPHRGLPVTVMTGGQTLIDLLSVVTQSYDLDFLIRDRKVVIDTREAIEKLLGESK